MSIDYLDVLYACGPYVCHSGLTSSKINKVKTKGSFVKYINSISSIYKSLLSIAKQYYSGSISKGKAATGVNALMYQVNEIKKRATVDGITEDKIISSLGFSNNDMDQIHYLLDDLGV